MLNCGFNICGAQAQSGSWNSDRTIFFGAWFSSRSVHANEVSALLLTSIARITVNEMELRLESYLKAKKTKWPKTFTILCSILYLLPPGYEFL